MKNNILDKSDAETNETDGASESHGEKRTPWVIASEVAGIEGMPTTDRRARDELERLSAGKDGVKRKRSGTKAFEYHASILPQYVLDELEKRGLFPDGVHVEHQSPSSTPYEQPKITLTGVNENATVYSAFLDEFALIPGYRVQVSAGHGSLTQGELEPCRHLAFRRKWLRWRGFDEKELAIVWSKGDSMEPTISNNDTLVVHLGRTRPVDGHIYVVRNDDQLWVKRLQVLPSAWLLLSDNKHYQPIEVPKDEQHTFEVIGQVVHIAHDIGE
ncbi:S24 family peptidase [Aeromonas caviae]|uniref:S24 family peptidase n=1 Tax=Aeromonas caviae TaxID=648 RepID=UPI002B47F357|nr:S24 family peptidase [Aeromonas caviae]